MSQGPTNGEQIAEGIRTGVKESRLQLTDRRLLYLAGFVVLFCILSSLWQQRVFSHIKDTQRYAYENCLDSRNGNARFNALLDHANASAQVNPAYSAAQKKQAADFYNAAHLNLPDCQRQRP